ncbi:MAG: glycine zipper 2TM domain-containing protein [Alphaproteobacteria bacterium]|nr:glycine zipper 2TM domain-containing protein [Alphaproteobacteria bacterium]
MKTLVLSAAALAALLPAAPAAADPPSWAPAYGRRAHDAYNNGYYSNGYNQAYNNGYYNQGYNNGYYAQGYDGPVWRGRNGRYYCRRSNGTTGLLVGGAAGALIGRSIDGGRDRTAGTLIGGVAGALLGREVQRSSSSRCR